MKTISVEKYKVTGPVKLASIPTLEDFNSDEKELKEALKKVRKKLAKFQDTMYAHARYGVLVCFQGMDISRKKIVLYENCLRILIVVELSYIVLKHPPIRS